MKVFVKSVKEVEVCFVQSFAEVRYWEDAMVNGVEDEMGDLIPCRDGDNWCPLIEVSTGKILNWVQGVKASIHYKVCDAGKYQLLDENKKVIIEREGYVPDIMCQEEQGYGDYIIMTVNEEGVISGWNSNCSIADFYDEEDD